MRYSRRGMLLAVAAVPFAAFAPWRTWGRIPVTGVELSDQIAALIIQQHDDSWEAFIKAGRLAVGEWR